VVPWECALYKGRAVGHPAVFTVSTGKTPWPRASWGCCAPGRPSGILGSFADLPDLNSSAPGEGESDAMSLLAPPGHPAQQVALIAAQFGSLKLTMQPPDVDLKVRPSRRALAWPAATGSAAPEPCPAAPVPQEPVLTTPQGDKIAQSDAIARYGEGVRGARSAGGWRQENPRRLDRHSHIH
jgi:hypothetical protein